MPITFRIYPGQNIILTLGVGELVADDLFDYYARLREDDDFAPDRNEIFDVSRASAINIAPADLKRFQSTTSVFTERGNPVKVAIVAPSDLEFAMSRMYEMLQGGNIIRVFRDRGGAEAWMNVRLD